MSRSFIADAPTLARLGFSPAQQRRAPMQLWPMIDPATGETTGYLGRPLDQAPTSISPASEGQDPANPNGGN